MKNKLLTRYTSINHRDNHWIEQISQGNRNAFNSLFTTYYPILYAYAFRMIKNPEKSDDIVQEVFIWIWSRREKWKPRSVKSYLFRSIYNRVMTNFRNERFEQPLWEDNVCATTIIRQLTPHDELINNELGEKIKRIICQIPERRREILVMRIYQDLSYKEIAQILEISVNTVDTQLRRAYQTLRQKLLPYRSHSHHLDIKWLNKRSCSTFKTLK